MGAAQVPKRSRYFLQRDGAVLNMVLRIFLRVIAQDLQAHCLGAANADRAALHIGAVAFIHRFGSSLNEHVHFHVCVVDGVFEEMAGNADVQAAAPGVVFHPASGIDADTVFQVQATLRRRILRAFVGRGLMVSFESKEMLAYKHSGFSVDAGVCIEAHDRAALERLLRYCARPPFAMDRLRKEGAELVYRCAKQNSEPTSNKRRHAVTAMAAAPHQKSAAQAEPPATGDGTHGPAPMGNTLAPTSAHAPPKHAAHYLWAVLIARIYEVFPHLCPLCGGQMRIIAFITHSADIQQILEHIGTDSEPPRIAPARGPPLWDECDAQVDEGSQIEPDWATEWDGAAQPVPDYEVDHRVNW